MITSVDVLAVVVILETTYILFNFDKTRELKNYVKQIKKRMETKS